MKDSKFGRDETPDASDLLNKFNNKFTYKPPTETAEAATAYMATNPLIERQPKPNQSTHPAIYDLVKKDFEDRDQFGLNKYGTRLQPFNGRDPLVDSYQEKLDDIVYTRQLIYEREFEKKVIDAAITFTGSLDSSQDETLMSNLFEAVQGLLDARGSK